MGPIEARKDIFTGGATIGNRCRESMEQRAGNLREICHLCWVFRGREVHSGGRDKDQEKIRGVGENRGGFGGGAAFWRLMEYAPRTSRSNRAMFSALFRLPLPPLWMKMRFSFVKGQD
jgi:hypothetical protein